MVGQQSYRCFLVGFTLIAALMLGRVVWAADPPIPESLAGQLLVAAPSMPDVRFAEAVI